MQDRVRAVSHSACLSRHRAMPACCNVPTASQRKRFGVQETAYRLLLCFEGFGIPSVLLRALLLLFSNHVQHTAHHIADHKLCATAGCRGQQQSGDESSSCVRVCVCLQEAQEQQEQLRMNHAESDRGICRLCSCCYPWTVVERLDWNEIISGPWQVLTNWLRCLQLCAHCAHVVNEACSVWMPLRCDEQPHDLRGALGALVGTFNLPVGRCGGSGAEGKVAAVLHLRLLLVLHLCRGNPSDSPPS